MQSVLLLLLWDMWTDLQNKSKCILFVANWLEFQNRSIAHKPISPMTHASCFTDVALVYSFLGHPFKFFWLHRFVTFFLVLVFIFFTNQIINSGLALDVSSPIETQLFVLLLGGLICGWYSLHKIYSPECIL